MKNRVIVVLVLIYMLTTVSAGYAEGFGSLFSNVSGELSTLLGGTSEDHSSEEENPEGEDSFLKDIGTIFGGLAAEETGIPKKIHYGDYELFKKDIDAIEKYFKEYVDFMNSYDVSDLSMLTEYTSFMASYVEAMRVLEALDESKMTNKEKAYFNKVLLRINKILYRELETK